MQYNGSSTTSTNTQAQQHHEKLLVTHLDAICVYYKKYINQSFSAEIGFLINTNKINLNPHDKNKTKNTSKSIKKPEKPVNPVLEKKIQSTLKRYKAICTLHHGLRTNQTDKDKIKQFNALFYSKDYQQILNDHLDAWGEYFLKIVDDLFTAEWSGKFTQAVFVFRKTHNDLIIKTIPLH